MSQIGVRDRGGWTDKSLSRLECIKEALGSRRRYWPLTLRQVYYQLVSAGHIENNRHEYQELSSVLVKAREDG